MGRKLVLSSKHVQKQIDDCIRSRKFRIGVLIGKLTRERDYVLHLARLPAQIDDTVQTEQDGSTNEDIPPATGVNITEPALDLYDDAWLLEHARQVNRMLPGGIQIVGIFVFCSAKVFDFQAMRLKASLRGVFNATERSKFCQTEMAHFERYQIQIDADTKRLLCRSIDIREIQNTWSPVEIQYHSTFDGWVEVSASLPIKTRFHIPKAKESSRIASQALVGISALVKQIQNAIAIENQSVVNEDEPLVKASKGNREAAKITFGLLMSDIKDTTEEQQPHAHCGVISYNGWMKLQTYLPPKATKGEAVMALKLDAVRSLLSRIELSCEESEINNIAQVNEWSLVSPQRVFVPLYARTQCLISLCDYMFKDESYENAIERFEALLDVTSSVADMASPETWPDDSMIRRMEEAEDTSENDVSLDNAQNLHNKPTDRGSHVKVIGGIIIAIMLALLAIVWEKVLT